MNLELIGKIIGKNERKILSLRNITFLSGETISARKNIKLGLTTDNKDSTRGFP